MDSRNSDDFFRDFYLNEIEHKHKLETGDSFLAVVLTALGSIALYDLRLLPSCSMCIAGISFWIVSLLYFAAVVAGIICAIGSLIPRTKAYISTASDLDRFLKGIELYHCYYHTGDEAIRRIEDEFQVTLRRQYIEAGDTNRTLAINKTAWQTRTRYCIIAAVLFMLCNAVPMYFVEAMRDNVQRVNVINLSQPVKENSDAAAHVKPAAKQTAEPASDATLSTAAASGSDKTAASADRSSP